MENTYGEYLFRIPIENPYCGCKLTRSRRAQLEEAFEIVAQAQPRITCKAFLNAMGCDEVSRHGRQCREPYGESLLQL